MAETKDVPTVKATVGAKLEVGGWRIIVKQCPFCKKQHVHMSRQTSGNLGQRRADCQQGEYIILVEG